MRATRMNLELSLANLTREQAWAFTELRDLFCDPDRAPELRAWLNHEVGLSYAPETGRVSTIPFSQPQPGGSHEVTPSVPQNVIGGVPGPIPGAPLSPVPLRPLSTIVI